MTNDHPLPYHLEDNFVMKKAPFSWDNLPQYVANTRKALIQLVGLLTSLLALGVLPHPYDLWISGAVAVLTTVSHYLVPNALPPIEYVDAGDGNPPREYVAEHALPDH